MKAILKIPLLALTICLLPTVLPAQEVLSGWVIDKEAGETMQGVHVVNRSTLKGTMTGKDGHFEIRLTFGDTIVFSNIGYQYYNFIYQDSSTALKGVMIYMEEENYMLQEAQVVSYKLSTNKPREIELSEPSTPKSQTLRSDVSMLSNDLESGGWLYSMLSSKSEQLAKLRQLHIEDAYRKKLEESNNRENVKKLTGLSQDELEAFMFYCKFSQVRISKMNDYQFLKSVQACFREFVREKELEGFLQQFD